ncbi:MAG: 30S ribosomal protein S12 methylthiotransferase RimO [Lachnospiraceae bacterium]|nr:30S ribosomal protein S12 methylthiotransferase RimO [Lachnospiraceae bacterium]
MKILMISLGCDKNLVDTENMLGLLSQDGHTFTDDEQEAEVVIVNTCCFIGDAKEESINTILEMAQLKEEGKCRILLVAGCLAQRYRKEILKEIPEVDGILGTASYDRIREVLAQADKRQKELSTSQEKPVCMEVLNRLPESGTERILTTGGHYAFLKIAEGCDKHCTYCIIPSLRGSYRSVPMERLVTEARRLAEKGVRELILVAQETTQYGLDLYGKKALPELLHQLAEISGIYWIRIQYCYPEEITDELIETIKKEEKVCHYLDIPIQHASDNILRRMGRQTDQVGIRRIVEKLRREIPDIALRTTMISGFPGETKEDHEELLTFVNELEFERLGVFAYSAEEDTPAAGFADQVPEEIKELRREQIMELQQEIAFEKSEAMVGRILEVMIEGKVADEPAYVARTYMDAPGVDGYLFVNSEELFMSGDFVRVRVTGAAEYDLIGEVYDEFAE